MNNFESNPDISLGLEVAAKRLGVFTTEAKRYGWQRKSVGCMAITEDRLALWLRVQRRLREQKPDKLWSGISEASTIADVRKPVLIASVEWEDGDWTWRGDLMSLIRESVCSATPELRENLLLTPTWFRTLRDSLDNLRRAHTRRVNTRQDLISRRIQEKFGQGIDTHVQTWTTVHGDIHWANLTAPECWILDWEAWGQGPLGLDVAFLLCFSLLQPSIADRVYNYFRDWLDTPDGIRSQLFACAELIRMAELYNNHPDLVPKLVLLAESLLPTARRRG